MNPMDYFPNTDCPTCGNEDINLTECPKCKFDSICPNCNYCTNDDCNGIEWVTFCRRTNDPKLSYIERQLNAIGILHRRNGESFHAPILEIPKQYQNQAWNILTDIDDLPDDSPKFY